MTVPRDTTRGSIPDGLERPQSPLRRLLGASAWTVGVTGINTAARLAEVILLARYLSPHGLGVFLLIVAYPEAVQQLLDCRAPEAMTRYLGQFLAEGRKRRAVALVKLLWLIDVAVSAVALAIVLLTAGFVSSVLLDDDGFGRLMAIYAVGMFAASLDTASPAILRVLDRFSLSFAVGATSALVRLLLIVAMISAGAGLEGLIWATVAASIAGTVVSGALAFRELKRVLWDHRRAPLSVLRDSLKEISFFLLSTNLAGTVRLASTKLDTLVVGLLAGPATVSIYKVALQLGSAPLYLSEPLFVAAYPSFVRAHTLGHLAEIRQTTRRLTILLAATAVPSALVLALEGRAVVGLTVGDDFAPAVAPFAIVLLSVLPALVFFWTRARILSLGGAAALLRIVTVATGLQIVGLFVFVPAFGATGAAISMAVMNLTAVAFQILFLHRRRLLW
jgi:O-antigen/teichoic acid export membrane protein